MVFALILDARLITEGLYARCYSDMQSIGELETENVRYMYPTRDWIQAVLHLEKLPKGDKTGVC